MDDAKTAYTTTTTNEPPPLPPKAAKKPAPKPQQPSGRTLRASTVAKSAAAVEALVSLKPPPPRRRAPKLDSTKETVESAADAAAKPSSLLRQPKLPVVPKKGNKGHGWKREDGKGEEEKASYRFLKASDHEFRRLYELYVACVEGELTLDEETTLLVEGLFGAFKELHGALAEVEEVHPTDERLANLCKCSLHLSQAAKAVASNKMTSCYFVEAISVLSGASRRGYSPKEALAEFDKHLDVVTKKRENREAYLKKTAEQGRNGRNKHGNIIVDAKTTVAKRDYSRELARKTRAGKREPRYPSSATEPTHALAVTATKDYDRNWGRKRIARAKRARKAAGVATPKDCTLALTLFDDGVPRFKTQQHLVPPGADNRPLIAEEAAARAVQHRAEKGKKTLAEMRADRRPAGMPDNVRASKAKSHAGQFIVKMTVNKDWPYSTDIRRKFKSGFSGVKPGTDGYYPSKEAAAKVLKEWNELKRPPTWMAKVKL